MTVSVTNCSSRSYAVLVSVFYSIAFVEQCKPSSILWCLMIFVFSKKLLAKLVETLIRTIYVLL